MRRSLAILAACAALALMPPASAASVTVQIKDNYFDDASIMITAGDRVTWRHVGTREHTVTSFPDSAERFNSSGSPQCVPNPIIGNDPDDCLDPGDTFAHTFSTPGTFEYYCKVHGTTARRPTFGASSSAQPCGMCGVIVVKTRATASPGGKTSTSPTATARPRGSASPSASPSPSPSPSASATINPDDRPVGSGRGLGRGAIALIGIGVLSGAGWWTWRRYLVPR